jgi:dipeptidyl aminopeptidase/acylaminoacyl peptidase
MPLSAAIRMWVGVFLLGSVGVGTAFAQADSTKRPITPDDYGKWESLGFSTAVSDDGEWFAYSINRVNDEDELRLTRLSGDTTITVPYGTSAAFSDDGRWFAYRIGVGPKERKQLEKQKKPVRSKLGLRNLATGDTLVIDDVAGFAFSDGGAYLAMRRYPPNGGERKHKGVDVVVRDLASGLETNFGNVAEYAWQDEGSLLALLIDAEGQAGNGIQLFDPRSGRLRTLESEATRYLDLTWREDEDDLAALRVRADDEHYEDSTHVVVAWHGLSSRDPTTFRFDPDSSEGFPDGMRIVPFAGLRWSDDGSLLYFGIQEREPKEQPDSAAADSLEAEADSTAASDETDDGAGEQRAASDEEEEPSTVQIWHARDVEIYPEQEVRANRDREESFLSVWHLEDGRLVQLETDLIEEIRIAEGDRYALGTDETPYENERMFGPVYRDLYVVDVATGDATLVKQRVQYSFGPSDGGRYLLYLVDDHYWTYDIDSGRHVNITEGLPSSFVDLDDDHTVDQKPPFGVVGWTENDRRILINDEYDVWEIRPDGSGGRRLTLGADDEIRHRRAWLDTDEEYIDLSEPQYFLLTGEWTKRSGYARLADGKLERLMYVDANVGRLTKAKEAEVYLYTAQDFADSPDYFVAGPRLADGRQVTRTNPFQDDYLWGRSELIEYENTWGERLQGALFYPADYEPGTQYPMIVYIYEIRSPSVHSYSVPSNRSAYNTAVWTSQGYFVLQPDIVYRDRNPGLSAVEAIVPAVETVLATGMVDSARLGLTGHSWGGYQTAFVVTQTDLFAAAVAGAPLTNLVSMYLSVYWNTGSTDARIFEISQGRMEVPFWQDIDAYIANSPVFHVESLNTPLLVAHGDEDGAVDFNQGVEYYNAARRAGKDFVLLVYEGENHGNAQKANQIDYHTRINEWFGHYLKGEPDPGWIAEGVTFLDQEGAKQADDDEGG